MRADKAMYPAISANGMRISRTRIRRTVHHAEAECLGSWSEHERAQLTEVLGKLHTHLPYLLVVIELAGGVSIQGRAARPVSR
jgi:hypothetical protein